MNMLIRILGTGDVRLQFLEGLRPSLAVSQWANVCTPLADSVTADILKISAYCVEGQDNGWQLIAMNEAPDMTAPQMSEASCI